MASPQMRVGARVRIANRDERRLSTFGRRAAARLLDAERSGQIFPILLEEIVVLGFARVMVAGVDFETGDVTASASIGFPKNLLQRFKTSLYAVDNPLIGVLHSLQPAVLPSGPSRKPLYCHPILFRARTQCRETERPPERGCLAADNQQRRRKLSLPEQVCPTCDLRAYCAMVIVELSKGTAERDLAELRDLIELANRCLGRLFKLEHYYDRMTDIEKLRRAEEVVRRDRDRLNLIIENVGDPIVVCDSNAKVVQLDPLATELFGAEKDPSRDPHRIRNQAKLDAYISAFTFSFSDRESGPLKLFDPATRTEVEFDARSGKVYDERGQVAFTVTVLRDLTAVRKLEQLKVERRLLEMEKFAATGRLAGTIAHEVNNPMEAIKNAVYLLSGKVSNEAVPVYEILKSETERVARIVRQMLSLYRNAEQVDNVNVNSVVEDTLSLFSRQLQRASIRVKADLGPLPPAVGSADQLQQVFSNLVVNARDSMEGGGTLRVRTRYINGADPVRGLIVILLGDTGSGIPCALQESIFEPFVSTKGPKGTGLGLWIVKGIIENHGGKIAVRSRPGKGTVFKISLPVAR